MTFELFEGVNVATRATCELQWSVVGSPPLVEQGPVDGFERAADVEQIRVPRVVPCGRKRENRKISCLQRLCNLCRIDTKARSLESSTTNSLPAWPVTPGGSMDAAASCVQGVMRGKRARAVAFTAIETCAVRLGTIACHNSRVGVMCFCSMNENNRFTTLAATSSETVYQFGQSALSSDPSVKEVLRTIGPLIVTHVACSPLHAVACTRDGDVYTWGCGVDGKLGHGDLEPVALPRMIATLEGEEVSSVAAGLRHTVITTIDGELFSWGSDADGRLGQMNQQGPQLTPKQIAGPLADAIVKEVAAGAAHTVVRCSKGLLWTWGLGTDGRLGHGTDETESLPRVVDGVPRGQRVVNCAAGDAHTVFCLDNGDVYSFGLGEGARLGHGDKETAMSPRLVQKVKSQMIHITQVTQR